MRICVFGAGAIGGLMAARLARTDADVSVVARGAHLEAIRGHGLTLVGTDGVRDTVAVAAAENPSDLGPQDVVILTLKAHQIPAAVPAIRVLLGEGTAIVHAVNGIPWWYFHRHGGPLNGKRLAAVDPGDAQWSGLGPARMIGCVVYPAAEVVQPGVVRHIDGVRFSVGEPSGDQTDRVSAVSRALTEAGFRAPVRPRIRDEIWLKLWGNLSFNPLSVLTHATLEQLAGFPGTRAIARAMMVEAQAIAEKLGVRFPVDVDRRIAGAEAVGAHRTSMLQDLDHGRSMEIDALVTVVQELGRLTDTPTPTIDTVLALTQLRAGTAGLYQSAGPA